MRKQIWRHFVTRRDFARKMGRGGMLRPVAWRSTEGNINEGKNFDMADITDKYSK